MVVAVCLPSSGFPTDGIVFGDGPPDQITMNIVGGSDAWYAIGTLAVLGVLAACHLAGIRRRIVGFIALGVSLIGLVLALTLPGTWQPAAVAFGEPYVLDAGFYLFLVSAVVAVVGALLMVITGFAGLSPKAHPPMSPSPS
jgi:hypothetical protein